MASDSAKEKASADVQEKEEDTTQKVETTLPPGSAPGSKPASAKSNKSRVKSPKSPRVKSPKSPRPKSPKSAKSSGKKSGKKKNSAKSAKDDNANATPELPEDLQAKINNFKMPEELPAGSQAVFLASKTQELFALNSATAEQPVKLVPKSAIQADMIKRAAVSDFSPLKNKINDYPEELIMIIADVDYKFGENFVIVLNIETKNALLVAPGKDGEDEEEEEELEPVIYQYEPPVPKDWISQGSENNIKEESLSNNRPFLAMTIKKLRREFGAPINFKDRNVADAKDAYIECAPYEDPAYDVTKIELDKGIQAIPHAFDMASQTDWKYPKNANTQYNYREFSEKQMKEECQKEALGTFMTESRPLFEEALQQNEIMNVDFDDWNALSTEDSTFGNKADNHLKEFQSFTDLLFSKEKTITCIDWHPTVKGLVAVSVAEKMTFDGRVDNAHKTIMTPSLILIWSFVDPIHPLLLLEAPEDIYCFKFNPTEPNYVCGGCVNGQMVMWDLSVHAERLKNQRSNKQEKKKNTLNTLPGYADENPLETPILRYSAVSSIEHSHKAAITDIQWVPDHFELNRMGVPTENRGEQCVQILTGAADHSVLLWDIRAPKTQEQKKGSEASHATANLVFKHLDLTWKPLMKVYLHKSEPGGDHNPTLFSISEVQGDRSIASQGSDELKESQSAAAGTYTMGVTKPTSAKDRKTLTGVNTHFYVGTEDGELVYVDWMPQKDQDSGKIQTPKPDYYYTMHDGPINCLQRSPFFKNILLVVGGWTFSIWKEGVSSGPILRSPTSKKQLASGFWSPSRPGVFYVAKEDGSIDIWDLLEKTHDASMNQNVSAHPITCIFPFQVTNRQHLLAVGDNSGTLHVMEIPWSLRHPTHGELQGVQAYLDRETARRQFVVERWNFREEEKREMEAENKRKMGIAPNVTLTDEEKEYRDKAEYVAFQDEEKNFLRLLGILREDEEPLPET